jgi:hypothetical protein
MGSHRKASWSLGVYLSTSVWNYTMSQATVKEVVSNIVRKNNCYSNIIDHMI